MIGSDSFRSMATASDPWVWLVTVIERLSGAHGIQEIVEIVRSAARALSGADGVCVVLRDGDLCHYVDEEAIGPLWKGRRFPMSSCISGWCMLNRQTAVIPDIYVDERIPHDAYRPTFVNSLVMVPVGVDRPCAAIGAYWATKLSPDRETVTLLEALARSTATALANASLYEALERAKNELEDRVLARTRELREANQRLHSEIAARGKAEERLVHSQKMEALGQLTGGIAHDFNNMLMVVQTSVDFLKRKSLTPERRTLYLDAIDEAARRSARLTHQLLAFARKQPLKPEIFDINDRLRDIAEMLRRTLGLPYQIDCELADERWPIETDPTQLEIAVLNIGLNARDAMPGGGRLTIQTQQVVLAADGERPAGQFIRVTFSDSGPGMPSHVLRRAFEPFFSTKEVGRGTGLGLSQVHGFAAQSGGNARIESGVGVGTTVVLDLPRAAAQAHAVSSGTAMRSLPASPDERICNDKVVLLVEDNPQVCEFAHQILEDFGGTVIRTENADAALEELEKGTRIDLVFSDVVMPGRSGIELAKEIRERWPRLPVILTTGYSDVAARDGVSGVALLVKPYRPDTLAVAIHKAMSVPVS